MDIYAEMASRNREQLEALVVDLQTRFDEAIGLLLRCSDPMIRNLPHVQSDVKKFLDDQRTWE